MNNTSKGKDGRKITKGDKVWVRLPMNAIVVGIDKKRGYTLKTEDGRQWSYFSIDEIRKI